MAAERKRKAAKARGTNKQQITISVIGAGRMGMALAHAFSARGFSIDAVVSRRTAGVRRRLPPGCSPQILRHDQLDKLPISDVLFITTPDDAIEEVASKLASRVRKSQAGAGRTVLHASGALSSSALDELRRVGFSTGSLHPLVSVSDPIQGAKSLPFAFFCLDGDRQAVRVGQKLVKALGARSFSINPKDKALYHAAAVLSSGHTTALFDIAIEMLQNCGLTARNARAILLPLLQSAVENLEKSEPSRALTGTFARADVATVKRHLDALRDPRLANARKAYLLLGLRSLQLADKAGAPKRPLKEIETLLSDNLK